MAGTLGWAGACAPAEPKAETVGPIVVAEFEAFHDIPDAPDPIRTAAAAVVRLGMATGGSGTGFFVSGDGVLATNNHVLGSGECVRTGCFVQISVAYQRGVSPSDAITVFAVPLAVNPTLDINLFQIQNVDTAGAANGPYTPPAFLSWRGASSADLVGSKIYVIGHPLGALKKWSEGTVLAARNNWFESDAFTMGGNSGSPILDANGLVVGINHRGYDGRENLTIRGFQTTQIGTASAPILGSIGLAAGLALNRDVVTRPDSVSAGLFELESIEAASLAAKSDYVLMARALPPAEATALAATSMLTAKAEACDAALNLPTGSLSPEERVEPIRTHCFGARLFMNCGSSNISTYKACPSDDERAAWQTRVRAAAAKITELSFRPVYFSLMRSTSALFSAASERRAQSRTELDAYVAQWQMGLNFGLAEAVLWAADETTDLTYGGVDLVAMVRDYAARPGYEREASAIAYCLDALASLKKLSREEVSLRLTNLLVDPAISLGDKLEIEWLAYEAKFI